MRRLRARLPLGPVVLDPLGHALTDDDRRRMGHPACGGVILFARNFENAAQLQALTEEIHALREPALLIGVDHEGGRVQRFRESFTALPPMRALGSLWDRDREAGRVAARAAGYVIAAELAAHGLDYSFTPVLDLDYGTSTVIGDRALHFDPIAVGALAAALIHGLADGGMAAVGKHFPGHGYVAADSHLAIPVDERPLAEILRKDLAPYAAAIAAGLAGVMPAHVVYPKVDPEPAGFSRVWLKDVLRSRLGFEGVVFSDDLSMAGASGAGDHAARARAALDAGCDMVLVCNDPLAADQLLAALQDHAPLAPERVERMRRRGSARDLRKSVAFRDAQEALAVLAA
jgi:beta-N-acetylhexosaminidase